MMTIIIVQMSIPKVDCVAQPSQIHSETFSSRQTKINNN